MVEIHWEESATHGANPSSFSQKQQSLKGSFFTMTPTLVGPWSCGHPVRRGLSKRFIEKTRTNMSARSATSTSIHIVDNRQYRIESRQ